MTDANICRSCHSLATCLAPDIVEAILDGRQPRWLRLAEVLGNGPLAWDEQRASRAVPFPEAGPVERGEGRPPSRNRPPFKTEPCHSAKPWRLSSLTPLPIYHRLSRGPRLTPPWGFRGGVARILEIRFTETPPFSATCGGGRHVGSRG